MSNSAWVCFECRLAVRRPSGHEADVVCAGCRAKCVPIGLRIPVPPKRDVRAWKVLQDGLAEQSSAWDKSRQKEVVRRRHALEQEIVRLEAMPSNPGRARAIRDLRKGMR